MRLPRSRCDSTLDLARTEHRARLGRHRQVRAADAKSAATSSTRRWRGAPYNLRVRFSSTRQYLQLVRPCGRLAHGRLRSHRRRPDRLPPCARAAAAPAWACRRTLIVNEDGRRSCSSSASGIVFHGCFRRHGLPGQATGASRSAYLSPSRMWSRSISPTRAIRSCCARRRRRAPMRRLLVERDRDVLQASVRKMTPRCV